MDDAPWRAFPAEEFGAMISPGPLTDSVADALQLRAGPEIRAE
jgi:hypothetical protein